MTKFSNFIRYISSNWKVINLGASQHTSLESIPKYPYYYPKLTDGSFAIMVHTDIFKELLQWIEPMNIAFDSGPLRYIYRKYWELCFVSYPNLIISDVTDSDIRTARDQIQIAQKFNWDLTLYDYPFQMALVSIIVCVYNGDETIEMSIRSIMRQTYRNLEIIVVDDGSTDQTYDIIYRLSKKDSRIKLIRNIENLGCYQSRNIGIRASTGKYITFQDADDLSLKNRVEQQLIHLLQYQVLFTTCLIIRSHLPNFNNLPLDDQSILNQIEQYRVHFKDNNVYKYCCSAILGMVTTLFCREIFYELGLYWELPCAADAEFCERILYHYHHKIFLNEESVVTYLSQNNEIPGIYYKIKQVLYVTRAMNSQNITTKYRDKAYLLKSFKEKWRLKLIGKYSDYEYPIY